MIACPQLLLHLRSWLLAAPGAHPYFLLFAIVGDSECTSCIRQSRTLEEAMATRRCLQQRVKLCLPRAFGFFHHERAPRYPLCTPPTLAQAILGICGGSLGAASYTSDSNNRKLYGVKTWKPEVKGARNPTTNRPPRREQPSYSPQERRKHSPGSHDESHNATSQGKGEVKQHVFMSSDFCDHRGMQIVFLGTSSSMPTLSRNTSCIALRLDGTIYMFDCGEGVQRQLHRTPFRQRTIDSIFITHMHGDHIFGLPGMTAPSTKQPIEIFGPQGLRQWIRTTLKLCHARVPIKYAVHELVLQEETTWKRSAKWNVAEERHDDELPGEDIFCSKDGLWHVHEDDKYVVVAGLLKHSIPCWGYVVEERLRPGRFSVDRALEAGVLPGPMYAMLQQGHTVSLSDGKMVKPSDVLGPPRKGRKVVILGDTSDSRSLLLAAKGADVLVHEATVVEHEAELAADRGHSTASMAGKFARSINVNTLVLTHFSGKLEGSVHGISEKGTISDLVSAARRSFGKDSVMAAHDLAAVTVVQQDECVQQQPSSALPSLQG